MEGVFDIESDISIVILDFQTENKGVFLVGENRRNTADEQEGSDEFFEHEKKEKKTR